MSRKRGFTLVELSIVLVILGLLVGGVLAGQSLIHAAELRTVGREHEQIVIAINAFKEKYFAIPGDMPNAQSFWGVANATPATCYTTASTDTKTCNGDGDGKIAPPTVPGMVNELFRSWQHLANAGLIEGNYDGIAHGSTAWSMTELNSMKGKFANGLWGVQYIGPVSGNPAGFDGDYGHMIGIGGKLVNDTAQAAIMKPEDAYNIDMKMDDGMPGQGTIVVNSPGDLANCTSTSSPSTTNATYLLSSQTVACSIAWRKQF